MTKKKSMFDQHFLQLQTVRSTGPLDHPWHI